ncbi:hypothetical protein D5086_001634 [Populus alba]|uniref:Uncharacterized protein n=1 Tax=Populus alba TaxID=43335 RepID=A0ACC4D0N2_POPAL
MFFLETPAKTAHNINKLFYELASFICLSRQKVMIPLDRFPKGSVSFIPFKAKRLARAYPSRPAGVNLNNETESRTQNHFVSPGSFPHQRVLAKAIAASPEGI